MQQKVRSAETQKGVNSSVCLSRSRCDPYQALLAQQTEQHGVAHFPQVLETHRLELGVLDDVLQLVVEELQDT